MIAVYCTVLALMLATVLVPLLAHYAGELGLLDRPGPRKIHHDAVPRVGGIAIAVGALVAVAVWLPLRGEIVGYIVGAVTIFIAGLFDDRLDLDYWIKFAFQIVAALIVIYLGGVQLTRVPFFSDITMSVWLGTPLTVIVLVGVTNAINLSDGMDGLAGGTSLLAIGAFGYMGYAGGDPIVALLALCAMGAILGFLRYNTHPACVFMGDSGSQFLGFTVAVLAILVIERSDTGISPLAPLLVLWLPILDTLQVMTRRIAAGRSPFSPDRQHLHHQLLNIGLSQYGAVLVIYILQGALVLLAWWLRHAPDYALLGIVALFTGALLFGLRYWGHDHSATKNLLPQSLIDSWVGYLRHNQVLYQVGRRGVTYSISLLFPVVAVLTQAIGDDIGWLSLCLFLLLLSCQLPLVSIPKLAISRLAVFTTAALTIYLAESGMIKVQGVMPALHVYLMVVLVFLALWLRFGRDRAFQLNALDVLIGFVVAIVPNIPAVKEYGIAPMIMETMLLFYASELVLSEPSGRWSLLNISTLVTLVILAARVLLFAGI